MNMSGDVLNAGETFREKYDYGFTGSIFKKVPIIIYDHTII